MLTFRAFGSLAAKSKRETANKGQKVNSKGKKEKGKLLFRSAFHGIAKNLQIPRTRLPKGTVAALLCVCVQPTKSCAHTHTHKQRDFYRMSTLWKVWASAGQPCSNPPSLPRIASHPHFAFAFCQNVFIGILFYFIGFWWFHCVSCTRNGVTVPFLLLSPHSSHPPAPRAPTQPPCQAMQASCVCKFCAFF